MKTNPRINTLKIPLVRLYAVLTGFYAMATASWKLIKGGDGTDQGARDFGVKTTVRQLVALGVEPNNERPDRSRVTFAYLTGIVRSIGQKLNETVVLPAQALLIGSFQSNAYVQVLRHDHRITSQGVISSIVRTLVEFAKPLTGYVGIYFVGFIAEAVTSASFDDGRTYGIFALEDSALKIVQLVENNDRLAVAIDEDGTVYMADLTKGAALFGAGMAWNQVASPTNAPIAYLSDGRNGQMTFTDVNGKWAKVKMADINAANLPQAINANAIVAQGTLVKDAELTPEHAMPITQSTHANEPAVFTTGLLSARPGVIDMTFVPPNQLGATASASA